MGHLTTVSLPVATLAAVSSIEIRRARARVMVAHVLEPSLDRGITRAMPSLPPTNTCGGFAIRESPTSASPSHSGLPVCLSS